MDQTILNENSRKLGAFLKDKTVMITGAGGLIGSRIAQYLDYLNETEGSHIRAVLLDLREGACKPLLEKQTDPEAFTFVACDLEKGIPCTCHVDHIIHCAGFSGGSKLHLTDPIKVFDTGLKGTRAALDYAAAHGCAGFLYVSTYEVYGQVSGDNKIAETQVCDLDTFELRNCYAEVKRLCESLLCAFSKQYGLNVYAARLTSTFGSGVRYQDPRFFAEFARCAIENRDIVLKSHGKTVRSYLDADDAAIAFLYILMNGESCNAYNLANRNNEISIREIAERIIALSGTESKLVFDIAEDAAKLGMRKEGRTVMDTAKIEAIGWRPVYDFDDTLKKLIGSMRASKEAAAQ